MGEVTIYYTNPYQSIYMGLMSYSDFKLLVESETKQSYYVWKNEQWLVEKYIDKSK